MCELLGTVCTIPPPHSGPCNSTGVYAEGAAKDFEVVGTVVSNMKAGNSLSNYVTSDSGTRREFSTGSVRDAETGKGRYDLVPPGPLLRLAQLYERGAAKYGDRNWEKGQPLMSFLCSAERHLGKLKMGESTEDHAAAIAWNVFGYMFTLARIKAGRLPGSLDDRPEATP